jgi:hypothetical protein
MEYVAVRSLCNTVLIVIIADYPLQFTNRTTKGGLEISLLSPIEKVRDGSGAKREDQKDDRNRGFDQLVLPSGHKDMVKSLIAQHFRGKKTIISGEDYSDVFRGKGNKCP